jgi:hypothetical protein
MNHGRRKGRWANYSTQKYSKFNDTVCRNAYALLSDLSPETGDQHQGTQGLLLERSERTGLHETRSHDDHRETANHHADTLTHGSDDLLSHPRTLPTQSQGSSVDDVSEDTIRDYLRVDPNYQREQAYDEPGFISHSRSEVGRWADTLIWSEYVAKCCNKTSTSNDSSEWKKPTPPEPAFLSTNGQGYQAISRGVDGAADGCQAVARGAADGIKFVWTSLVQYAFPDEDTPARNTKESVYFYRKWLSFDMSGATDDSEFDVSDTTDVFDTHIVDGEISVPREFDTWRHTLFRAIGGVTSKHRCRKRAKAIAVMRDGFDVVHYVRSKLPHNLFKSQTEDHELQVQYHIRCYFESNKNPNWHHTYLTGPFTQLCFISTDYDVLFHDQFNRAEVSNQNRDAGWSVKTQ